MRWILSHSLTPPSRSRSVELSPSSRALASRSLPSFPAFSPPFPHSCYTPAPSACFNLNLQLSHSAQDFTRISAHHFLYFPTPLPAPPPISCLPSPTAPTSILLHHLLLPFPYPPIIHDKHRYKGIYMQSS